LKFNEIYTELEIDITNYCNLQCPLCFRENMPSAMKNNSHMSFEDFKLTVSKFPSLKVISFGFLISEPSIHPQFLEFIKYCKKLGKSIVVSTNGNVRNKAFWAEFASLLDETDRVFWPIDGSTQDMYAKYRVKGSLSKVLGNQQVSVSTNPRIEHITQFIQFKHNVEASLESIKEMTRGTTFQEIACCGDCSDNDSDVEPRWDFKKYRSIKKLRVKTLNPFECESRAEKIVFVSSEGIIGFCPSQLGDYLLNHTHHITIYDNIDAINQYIEETYTSRASSSICQFNCGTMAKKLKALTGLSVVTK